MPGKPTTSVRLGPLAGRNDLAMKTEPVVVEFLAHLADPAGRDLELLAQVRGALVARHGPDDTPLTGRKGPQPGREVNTKGDLVGDRGEGVVAQPFLEGVQQRLAVRVGVEVFVRAAG